MYILYALKNSTYVLKGEKVSRCDFINLGLFIKLVKMGESFMMVNLNMGDIS